MSNTWKARIAVMTTVNNVTGANSGQVTRRNRAPPSRAPSIAAASYNSDGMAVRPAMKSTMLKPTLCQMPMPHRVNSTSLRSCRKSCALNPIAFSAKFTPPIRGSSMKPHTIAMAISVAITGRK